MDSNKSENLYKNIFAILDKIECKYLALSDKIKSQDSKILALEESKKNIEKKYGLLLSKVEEYIQELEDIRQYVNNNDKFSK